MNVEKRRMYRTQLYAGSLVIFIGVFYLLTILVPLFQDRTAISISFFSLHQAKMLFYVIFYISGGVLLLLSKRTGWIICTASLLNIFLITAFVLFDSLRGGLGQYQIIPTLFLLLAGQALFFMFLRTLRSRFSVNNKAYLLVIMLYGVLLVITYQL